MMQQRISGSIAQSKDPNPTEDGRSVGLPPQIRACLFDLDGVLTQTAKLHIATWKAAFDDFLQQWNKKSGQTFTPFDPVQDYENYVDGRLRLDGARSFLASRNIYPDENILHHLAEHKNKLFHKILKEQGVEVHLGSIRYVRSVREAGLRTAVVTASKHCTMVLASAGITELFDVRIDGNVASERHLAGKPAPDTYLAAAHDLSVDPKEAAVFEDAPAGVAAGKTGHFGYIVGVDRAGQSTKLWKHGASIVVKDLSLLLPETLPKKRAS